MTLKIVGDEFKDVERVVTGNWSYDHAVASSEGGIGHPLWSLVEVHGPKGVGKSSWSTDMAGRIAKATGNDIDYCDIEGQSKETIIGILEHVGFDGKIHYASYKKGESPNALLERFSKKVMLADSAGIGVFDSLGAIMTDAELSGDLDDANVGERAKITGRMAGRFWLAINNSDYARTMFMINHEHQTFGGLSHGFNTSGGVKQKYLSHLRVRLTDAFIGTTGIQFEKHSLMKGLIEENRYGLNLTTFYAYLVKGEGIHNGLTNMWTCVALKLAKLSSKSKPTEGTTVSMDDVQYGALGEIFDRRNDDPKFFDPFINKLNQAHVSESDSQEETNE